MRTTPNLALKLQLAVTVYCAVSLLSGPNIAKNRDEIYGGTAHEQSRNQGLPMSENGSQHLCLALFSCARDLLKVHPVLTKKRIEGCSRIIFR